MKKLKSLFKFILLLVMLVLLYKFFIPTKYDIDTFEIRKGTQYWQLETGSKIGYYKVSSNSLIKKNPIIYLHGGPGGIVTNEIIDVLAPLSEQGHDIYFYDQIGSGHSNRLENITEYTVDRHQRDLKEIIEKTQANKVILIGQSWGALLAINYIEENHKTVEKIILTGPGPILAINKNMINVNAPDSLMLKEPEFSNQDANNKIYSLRSHLIMKCAYLFNSKLTTDYEADQFFSVLNQELSKATHCKNKELKKVIPGLGYYSHLMTIKSFQKVENNREILKEIETPFLIMRGQCDNQKWGFTKEYLDLFKNSRLEIIKGSGHDIIASNKEKYFELIQSFISEN